MPGRMLGIALANFQDRILPWPSGIMVIDEAVITAFSQLSNPGMHCGIKEIRATYNSFLILKIEHLRCRALS